MKMLKKPLLWLIPLCLAAVAVIVIFSTAHYSHTFGRYQISHAPYFVITFAASDRWIVRRGINFVPDRGNGWEGNIMEFPIYPGYRASIRFYSRRWWDAYQQNHKGDAHG